MLHNQINMGYNLKYFIILKDDNSNIKFAWKLSFNFPKQ